jgi:hypothetical protein
MSAYQQTTQQANQPFVAPEGLDEWLTDLRAAAPDAPPVDSNFFRATCTQTEDRCTIHGTSYNRCDCI